VKRNSLCCAAGLLAALGTAPLQATIAILSLTPSVSSPQPLGTPVTWTATATDSQPNDLTFRFNVASGTQPFVLVRDFNIGTLSDAAWTLQPFIWTTIAGEGAYQVEVVAKDFVSGETATRTASFNLTSRVSGRADAVNTTGNALVALFSAPSCATGSAMRVGFYTGSAAPNYTAWAPCTPPVSMNFYVAGMLPSTTYAMYSQTETGGKITKGPNLGFISGALPSTLPGGYYPTFTVNTEAPANDPNPMVLWSFTKIIVPVATDLSGNIMRYYGNGSYTLLTRPVPGSGTMLTIQNGLSWDSVNQVQQLLREIDLAGNIVRETNTGVIASQLAAMGVTDATPCGQIPQPPAVGDACLNDFHHDAVRYTIGDQQYTAFLAHIEKLFAPGTQGNTSGNPVDVLSEMLIVLNSNWQVVWYYDAFNELDINRTAPLGETCTSGNSDCPTVLFLGTMANDWTHGNTVDYVAASSSQNPDSGDFLLNMRNQDQVIKIAYKNGTGTCAPPPAASCIAWYMGPPDGYAVPPHSFTFVNITNDPWPWFSHAHDVTYANNGQRVTVDGLTGPLLTIFDDGNTRYSAPPLGLGQNCGPSDCNSRGMALIVDETKMKVRPVMLQDLGVQTTSLGAAQLLSNGNYFFQPGIPYNEAIEIQPTTSIFGSQVMNLGSGDYSERSWQMPDLYNPPVE
jgi:hypothetical protein